MKIKISDETEVCITKGLIGITTKRENPQTNTVIITRSELKEIYKILMEKENPMPKFIINQISICPKDPIAAHKLLFEMGAVPWNLDTVTAEGEVNGISGRNVSQVAHNYNLVSTETEFEILDYSHGPSWLADKTESVVASFGMNSTEEHLSKWKEFFAERNIDVCQEVNTIKHANPAINDVYRYHFCIFRTRDILGVDIKFIVRRNLDESVNL